MMHQVLSWFSIGAGFLSAALAAIIKVPTNIGGGDGGGDTDRCGGGGGGDTDRCGGGGGWCDVGKIELDGAHEDRSRIAIHNSAGKKAIARLDSKLKDAHLKNRLRFASGILDLVEHGCLSKETMKQERTRTELAWWLRQSERLLAPAIEEREYVEHLVVKYGPYVRSF
jgi:hypothetical protein